MMTGSPGTMRLPSWKERENNKRRERRRRAIAAKIFAGLRLYGNYKLPKHCDNNEVLKALCTEAGWTVQDDGSTYRKGSKAPTEQQQQQQQRMEVCTLGASPRNSASAYPNDGTSLIPWLKGLSSSNASGTASTSSTTPFSSSAPVTPPLSSPTGRGVPLKPDWDVHPFASNQSHLRPGYCDTPDGARTPVEEEGCEPCGLEFATVCGLNSSKWTNGVRVRSGGEEATFSHPWRNPMQKSISVPVSPVLSRMKGSFGELRTVQGLGSLWELDGGAAGVKRKLPAADDLELTLGSSSLRAL